MRKQTGTILIEWYDELGHKEGFADCMTYTHGRKIAKLWESLHPGNSVVISNILYNTHSKNEKWNYNNEFNYTKSNGIKL